MTYRNPALLSLAAKAPHCMLCPARNEGQVVSAHSNQQRDGKGMGMKASDAAVAFVCWTCHGRIDQGNESREIKTELWERAHRATMRWLIENGFLLVSLVSTPPPVVATKPSRKIGKSRPIQNRGFDKAAAPQKIASRGFQKRSSSLSGRALGTEDGRLTGSRDALESLSDLHPLAGGGGR